MNTPRPAWQAIRLPSGRLVTFGAYVRAFKAVKALPERATVNGWQWFPVEARDVVRDYRRAIDDRVNQRGGLRVRHLTPSRLRRLLRNHAKSECRWCGQPLGEYREPEHRFCDAGCRVEYHR